MTESVDRVLTQTHVLASSQPELEGLKSKDVSVTELAAFVESILLVAPDPPTVSDIALAFEVETGQIEAAVAHLQMQEGRGWVIQRHGDRLELATAPRFADRIRRYLGLEREAKLSGAALETLAIIAYQQPITRSEIDTLRGVDCSGVLATLHGRGLVDIVGKRASLGNPNEYGTTPQFLRVFGLRSLADLPELGAVEGEDVAVSLAQTLSVVEDS